MILEQGEWIRDLARLEGNHDADGAHGSGVEDALAPSWRDGRLDDLGNGLTHIKAVR